MDWDRALIEKVCCSSETWHNVTHAVLHLTGIISKSTTNPTTKIRGSYKILNTGAPAKLLDFCCSLGASFRY